jgi:hypothetical protein
MADFCRRTLLTVTLLLVSGDAVRGVGYSAAVIGKSTEIARQHMENITLIVQTRMHKVLDEATAVSRLLDNKQHNTQMNVLQEMQLREKLCTIKGTLRLQLPLSKLRSGQYIV